MDRKFWAGMRANGFMLVDAEKRKIAIFANQTGELVIATDQDGDSCVATICTDEFNRLDELIHGAQKTAIEIDSELSAGYAAHEAIFRAAGNR